MKAVAYQKSGNIEQLQDIEIEIPTMGEHDITVEVKAISVNPVDVKIRKKVDAKSQQWKILGWDAAGVITAKGTKVEHLQVGDEVWYAGDLNRQGTNAELHVVDARIVSAKPKNLSFAEAAALPLTSITAWEMLFERLQVQHAQDNATILIIGAAGGVGSIAVQLLKARTNLKIIGTASSFESQNWLKKIGVDYVINHKQNLFEQIKQLSIQAPAYIFSTTHTDEYLPQIVEIIIPQGKFGLIDDPQDMDINIFKRKSISIHWESMFTRSTFQTADLHQQGEILANVAQLIEDHQVHSTLQTLLSPIHAENIRKAHRILEQGHHHGKIVIADF